MKKRLFLVLLIPMSVFAFSMHNYTSTNIIVELNRTEYPQGVSKDVLNCPSAMATGLLSSLPFPMMLQPMRHSASFYILGASANVKYYLSICEEGNPSNRDDCLVPVHFGKIHGVRNEPTITVCRKPDGKIMCVAQDYTRP